VQRIDHAVGGGNFTVVWQVTDLTRRGQCAKQSRGTLDAANCGARGERLEAERAPA
jgi:hypothetical protein